MDEAAQSQTVTCVTQGEVDTVAAFLSSSLLTEPWSFSYSLRGMSFSYSSRGMAHFQALIVINSNFLASDWLTNVHGSILTNEIRAIAAVS